MVQPTEQRRVPDQGSAPALVRAVQATSVLAAPAVLAWGGLVWMVVDMGHPLVQLMMPASSNWSAANVLAIGAMWALMMAAMMLPSALPMVLAFVTLARRTGEPARGGGFVAGYLAVWAAFSVAATAAQWLLQSVGAIDPMIASRSPLLTAGLLLVAGLYQFSPLKRRCLASCRTPLGFLLGEWRPGVRGAWVMGARHGAYCVGCCWALMALLFVGGAMNLAWVAALAVAVALEKLLPRAERLTAALGIGLLGVGTARLIALTAGAG